LKHSKNPRQETAGGFSLRVVLLAGR
jgi:hypothetical protein